MDRVNRKVVWAMKVLLINHFPLEGSGSGTYTKNIALHLRKRGHEVAVIFPENQPGPYAARASNVSGDVFKRQGTGGRAPL